MRTMAVAALLAVACSPVPGRYARIDLKPGHALEGPRQVTIVGDDDKALDQLEAKLEMSGYRVSRDLPGVFSVLKTRYVLKLSGSCWSVTKANDMRVDVHDASTDERVLVAKLTDNDWCPRVFFDDLITGLDKAWSAAPTVAPVTF